MLRETQQANYMLRSIDDAARGSAAPADIMLPPDYHPLRALLNLPQPKSAGAFLGYIPLLLALCGIVAYRIRAARWAILALLAWLLSLGPALPFYQLLYQLPPLQVARYPDRFTVLLLLGLAVLVALGINVLLEGGRQEGTATGLSSSVFRPSSFVLRRPSSVIRRSSFVALLLGLLLFELHPRTTPLVEPIGNPYYDVLATSQIDLPVLELPINRANNRWVDMAAQTIHGKPILYGGLARDVPGIPFERLPMIREMEYPDAPTDIVTQSPEARNAALNALRLRYVFYHRNDENGPVTPPTEEELSRATDSNVIRLYADSELVAFVVEVIGGPQPLPPITWLDQGWYDLETTPNGPQRWIDQNGAVLQVYADTDGTAQLRMRLFAYQQPQTLDIFLNGQSIGQLQVQPWETEFTTPPFNLSRGTHTLRLVPTEPGISPREAGKGDDERLLTIAVHALEVAWTP
jgi:hypothetical protein